MRDAQRHAADRLDDVAVVPTLDLPLSDAIHTSPAGNLLLAGRMATAALDVVHGRPVEHRAPDIQSAILSDDGLTLGLAFANVRSRLECIHPAACPFRVEDDHGEVPIERTAYPQDNTARLHLERGVIGTGVVHGAWDANPEAVPMDVERTLPMLGFYGVRIG